MITKAESRRIRIEIRRVLLRVWDPIGIKDEPNAQDEYDSYIGEIYELLTSGAPDDRIAECLWLIASDRMGLTAEKKQMTDTVNALRQIQVPKDSN